MFLERPHIQTRQNDEGCLRRAFAFLRGGIGFNAGLGRKSRIFGGASRDSIVPRYIRVPKRYYLRFGALEALKHIMGGIGMNKVIMLNGAESEEILRAAIENKVPAIMSYLSRDKWHVAKVLMIDLSFPPRYGNGLRRDEQGVGPDNRLTVMSAAEGERPRPINIQVNQPVGISFKHEYGKFVFDTKVVALESSPAVSQGDNTGGREHGGRIVLAVPDRMEVLQRRSYFRVNVPETLSVKVTLWHRNGKFQGENQEQALAFPKAATTKYFGGKLIDISAGGAQVMILKQDEANDSNQGFFNRQNFSFKKGQFIGLRFTPIPYETPLMFSAQIRHILPSEDNKSIYLGLQIVGLEASPEGRQILSRIAGVVEHYYQLNRSGAKQAYPPAASSRIPSQNHTIST